MNKSKTARVAAFIGALGASAALIGAAVSGTGAYFQGTTPENSITGTMGSIKIDGVGDLGVVFQKMLPGETNSKTVQYQNTGDNEQDVWVVFTDASQLHALNQTGTFSEVHVASNGTERFASQNLNDGYACGTPGNAGVPNVCPLPSKIKLADNLAPGQRGDMTFAFKPSSKYVNYQGAQILGLKYKLVATQHGIDPS